MAEESAFQRKLRERKEALAAKSLKPEPAVETALPPAPEAGWSEDLVPDEPFERSDEDRQMDMAIDSIDILDAYRRWCGKNVDEKTINRTEGVMVSCPTPDHRDNNPSAWINKDKQTWFCGACQVGGDKYDIAAYHFGYPVPDYKNGARFHELRRDMAVSMGFTFKKMPGNITVMTAPVIEADPKEVEPKTPAKAPSKEMKKAVVGPEPKDTSEKDAAHDEEMANLIEMFDDDDDILLPTLHWRDFVPDDTFLGEYMKVTSQDDVAEEYHFWNGLVALGFACGKNVRLFDDHPVYGNLFVCTLGKSGAGKSKAVSHLLNLLSTALPHKWDDPMSVGTRRISQPGSAEALIVAFQKPVMDPTDVKKVAYYAPVRGLVDFSELSALVGRTNRAGNVTTPTLMEFYDMSPIISSTSLSTGNKEAHHPFASVITTTQPKALRGLITQQDAVSGFLNRWVFVPGKEKKRTAVGARRIDTTPAVAPLKHVLGWASSFKVDEMIQWSPEALERFTEFFHSTLEPMRKMDETSLLTRVDLLMKKLILLFSANREQKVVSLQTVEDAISCHSYIVASYHIPAGQIDSTPIGEVTDAILTSIKRAIEKTGKGLTMSQITRNLARKKYPNELIIKSVEQLIKVELIDPEAVNSKGPGRSTVRYRNVS